MNDAAIEQTDWPERPWLLAALGAVSGLLIHLVLGDDRGGTSWSALQGSAALFIGSFAALVAYTIEKRRWQWALGFSAAGALIIALIGWWNGTPDDWSAAETWRMVCAFLAVSIAAPLFQTVRDQGAWRLPYVEIHGNAWANVVMWFASWAFVGVAFLLSFLLAELFALIGIKLIEDALEEQWFALLLIGTALGAAIGVFRKRDGILRLLLKVVVAVLGVLAPVLGVGLLIFLASLPFTGLSALWDATRSTTPILLSCVVGALILANVVIGDSEEEESRFPPLRWGAMALALSMLPLAAIAAISTGARIQPYGFTPDRLWALIFVIVACAYGLAYLVALMRGRAEWAAQVRPANLRLAIGLCALALFLALPILSFNAISTRDQVARLKRGEITAEKFDWAALRFDFGDPGRAAIERLAASASPEIRKYAKSALAADSRYSVEEKQRNAVAQETLASRLRVLPATTPIPPELMTVLSESYVCGRARQCTLLYSAGAAEAYAIPSPCNPTNPRDEDCGMRPQRLILSGARWERRDEDRAQPDQDAFKRDYADGKFEIRTVERRQLFLNGKPIADPF